MKNKKNRVNIIGKLLYLVVAVLVLMIIPSAAEMRMIISGKSSPEKDIRQRSCMRISAMVITADYQKRWHITALLEEQSQKMTGTTMLSVPATTAQLIIICTGQPEKQTKLPIHLRYFIRMNQNSII